MKVEIYFNDENKDILKPIKATPQSACYDVHAAVTQDTTIQPGEIKLIPTGIFMKMPQDWECQIRGRSGLALKNGIFVLNSPGTIDSDYRNEVGVIISNIGKESFVVKRNMRIAQMIFCKLTPSEIQIVDTKFDNTERNGGFGSTGL